MVDRPFLESQKWQEQQWRATRWTKYVRSKHTPSWGAHPDILEFEKVMIRELAKMGIPMFAHSVIRTAAQQTELFVKGVSKAKAGQSPHNYGCAVDIVHSTRAWNLSKLEWELIGHIGKEHAGRRGIKVTWGGDWRFYDPAHWQLEKWENVMYDFPFPERVNRR